MQFLLFKEEKFYALCTLKDKNFAPKQNERDCPMTESKAHNPSIYAGLRAFSMCRDNQMTIFLYFRITGGKEIWIVSIAPLLYVIIV